MATNGKQVLTRTSPIEDLADPVQLLRDLRWPFARGAWKPLFEREQPAMDMFERDGAIVVKAELPGVKAEDVDVQVTDGQLTITGVRQEESEVRREDVYRMERSYGRIVRSVALPQGCDAARTEATLKDGVLEITIPKSASATPKKIDIKTG